MPRKCPSETFNLRLFPFGQRPQYRPTTNYTFRLFIGTNGCLRSNKAWLLGPRMGLFFGMSKLLSKPICINSLG
jgi:hypothetical protein